ncbi:PH domain-containing protein [Arcanobacterium hippocoleae]
MSKKNNQRAQLGADTVPEDQWRKFHKITPISQLGAFWVVILAIAASSLQNLIENVKDWGKFFDFAQTRGVVIAAFAVSGILLGVSLLIVLITWLAWRKMSYAVAESGIHLRKGIFFVNHTHMRWDRVQTVDIEQKLFGRIFGFGSLKVSSAGTSEDIELGLLRLADCAKLRTEILRVLNLVRSGMPYSQAEEIAKIAPAAEDPDSAVKLETNPADFALAVPSRKNGAEVNFNGGMQLIPEAEIPFADADQAENDREIFTLPLKRLIGASVLDSRMVLMLLFAIPVIVIPIVTGEGYFAIILPIIGFIWTGTKSLFDDFGTKIYLSENGLRRRSGLTTLKTRTYPPQRIHAVEIRQPIIWRKADWWEIRVAVAGNMIFEGTELLGKMVLAAKREEAVRLLWTILPRLGSADDARLLKEALTGQGTGEFFVGASKRAKIFDPISLSGRGFFASKDALVIRSGRWGRKVTFVLQDHTQSLRLSRGPLQARKGVATLAVHLVLGSIRARIKNFDTEVLTEFYPHELELTKLAREEGVSETLQEWKERLGMAAPRKSVWKNRLKTLYSLIV